MAPPKKVNRSVEGSTKVESRGNTGKSTPGKRYTSGAPARGTQARKDMLADMQRLVNYVSTGKFKNWKEKRKIWAQIDNYRVALGTLKEDKRKSKSNATGVSTYADGTIKVKKEAGFDRDSGRGGGRKSSQMADGGGKPTKPKGKPGSPKPRPVYVQAGQSFDYMPFDGAHPEKSKRTAAQVYKDKIVMPAEKAKQGESRKDYILRKTKEGLAKGGTRGR